MEEENLAPHPPRPRQIFAEQNLGGQAKKLGKEILSVSIHDMDSIKLLENLLANL